MVDLAETKKRNVAYRLKIGDVLKGRPISQEARFAYLELGDKKIVRVNIIANCVDKFISEGEKKYATVTLDDASGQLRIKTFGDDVTIVKDVSLGDTLQIIGNIREWNAESYILPEVVKRVDPRWLLVRKLELQKSSPEPTLNKGSPIRNAIMQKIRDAEVEGGIEIEVIKAGVQASSKMVDEEIKTLLEEGLIYEPRPGKMRYLG